ncbi:dihydrolipoamide dehydrogenase [Nitrospira sp. SCGC AG-212-E16]|nr:dihydrolipoamide dehydrogenase [Nitrospira sp. SCGC AG-212-E16]
MLPEENAIAADTSATSSITGKIVVVLLFLSAIGAFFFFDLKTYLSLDTLKANRDSLLTFTEEHYVPAVALFILIYVLQTSFSLPGATIMTLAGGFLFGSLWGPLYVNIGATTGATLAFLAARYLFHQWVERKFGDRLGPIQDGFAQNAFSYLLTLRLIPFFPFFLVNLLSGLTRVKVSTYVVATAIGIIPGSVVYAFAGRQLGTINTLSELVSPRLLLAFSLLGLLMLVPVIYRKFTEAPRPQL